MEDWKECTIQEVTTYKKGFAFKLDDYKNSGIRIVKVSNLNQDLYDETKYVYLDPSEFNKYEDVSLKYFDIVISTVGSWPNNPNSVVGKVTKIPRFLEGSLLNQNAVIFRANKFIRQDFLYYLLKDEKFFNYITGTAQGSASQASIKLVDIMNFSFNLPPLSTQQKIAQILSSLDDKIELNNQINANLEQQAQALFKSWFVDFEPFGGEMPAGWKTCKAEEYFDITIGKTPPRKEQEWFSDVKSQNTVKWVSISDMGNCGTYISDSSEYLTKEAITKHNVKLIPADTVILSFKLTVGRIAITDDELCTNEAIAHFGTKNKDINEYLYIYLKNFSYQAMGSTSSIAVAVNSKIIKAMPFIVPDHETITKFHNIIGAIFEQIRNNQRENKKLSNLRDTLLPKLMNGEILK